MKPISAEIVAYSKQTRLKEVEDERGVTFQAPGKAYYFVVLKVGDKYIQARMSKKEFDTLKPCIEQ